MSKKMIVMTCPTCGKVHIAYRVLIECYSCSYKRVVTQS